MNSRGRATEDNRVAQQRTSEIKWLVNQVGTAWRPRHIKTRPDRILRSLHPLVLPERATQIEDILWNTKLVPLLTIIAEHNNQPRELAGYRLPRKDHLLLAPYLVQIFASIEGRNEVQKKLPVLARPPAEVRNHLRKVAGKCKALAKVINQGPQPCVALAGKTRVYEWLKPPPWTELFEASDGSERQIVRFTELMERAAEWFDERAQHVPRAAQNLHAGKGALRVRATEVFLPVLKRLGQPYCAHVATIATMVSTIETHADFVRQVELQQTGATRRRQRERLARKTSEALP